MEAVVEAEVDHSHWHSEATPFFSVRDDHKSLKNRKPPLLGLLSLDDLLNTPSDRVVSVDLILLVLVCGPLFPAVWFAHELGGSAGLDNRLVDDIRGRTAGATMVIWVCCSSMSSSRCPNPDSRRCRCLTEERRDRFNVDRRRASGMVRLCLREADTLSRCLTLSVAFILDDPRFGEYRTLGST